MKPLRIAHRIEEQQEETSHEFNALQKIVLRRSHPKSIFVDTVGMMWMALYVWRNLWLEAVLVVVAARLFALALTWNVDFEKMAGTTLGRIALLHLDRWNLMLQTLGAVTIIYGLWVHGTNAIFMGLSLLLLGHLRGWGEVSSSLKTAGKV